MLSLPFSQPSKPEVPVLDYEVAELTWENGQVAMHGFGLPRFPMKPVSSSYPEKYMWEKPRVSAMLESVVTQAAYAPPHCKEIFTGGADNEDSVAWSGEHRSGLASATLTMDALVPCSIGSEGPAPPRMDTSLVGCSIDCIESHSVTGTKDGSVILPLKRAKMARVHSPPDLSSRNPSISASATFVQDSQHVSYDTYDGDLGVGFTTTSPENTSSGKPCTKSTSIDDHDSIVHSKPQRDASEGDDKKKGTARSYVSNKRSRAAAIHNQSERNRRCKINQKMKTLQKLVPNSSKTDKASMLDEVIEYLQQLETQVQMMRMNMPPMMLPPPLAAMQQQQQQQLQMSMLQAPMGLGPMIGPMGMGFGIGMDMNSMSRSTVSGVPPVFHPAAFMFINPWDCSADRLQPTSAPLIPDPLSSSLSCQSQPINMDAYCRLAAMYQQIHQQTMSTTKN